MNSSWDEERRNYRGGQNRPVWIVDLKTYDLVTPPWTDSNDKDPVWVGDAVYFLSDRDGVSNVWSFEPRDEEAGAGHEVRRLRRQDAQFAAGNTVVFEQAGQVHMLDAKSGREQAVNIRATGDFPVDDAALGRRHQPDVSNIALSPTGQAASSRKPAARSSPSRRRRVTSATSPHRRHPRSASRHGPLMESTSHISATSRVSTSWSSRSRTG